MTKSRSRDQAELAALKADNDDLRRALRRLVPGFKTRDPKTLDAGWKAMVRIRNHLQELAWLSEPGRAAVYDSSTGGGGERSTYPGVTLATDGASADDPEGDGTTNRGNRNLYHPGHRFGKQLERTIAAMDRLVDSSEVWIKGLDVQSDELPRNRRPRCVHCGGELALAWRFCATCGRPAESLEVVNSVKEEGTG